MAAEITPFRIERHDDGELRIGDAEMADRLGYADVKDFRALIKRHIKTLNKINQMRVARVWVDRPQGGSVQVTTYSLSEHQATYIVTKSDKPIADDITVRIIHDYLVFKNGTINQKLYGAVGMELLGFAPRTYAKEYPESFFLNLHRVAGWTRPEGNNHSNCAHFINRYVYEFLFGELGLAALKEANPSDEGQRAFKHHQILKDKHMPRLRQHVEIVAALLANAISLDMFDDAFNRVFPKMNTQVGFLFGEMPRTA